MHSCSLSLLKLHLQKLHRYSSTANGIVSTVTKLHADWDNRLALQNQWSLVEKGWHVDVQWKYTGSRGIGLFAAQNIPAGTILRTGANGVNLIEFESQKDIDTFLHDEDDGYDYKARLRYVADYLWGFNRNTDEQGYEIRDGRNASWFFGMWIPGNGLNHSPNPNTVYRAEAGGTDEGILLVSLTDVTVGDELFDDYRRHGSAPDWLREFSRRQSVDLNFADCNDFV